jgi:RNA-directed DNA polymerase
MQALYLQAIEPLAEVWADPNSYGFRNKRSTQDAIEQCHIVLSTNRSPRYILEGDIRDCFGQISHDWLLKNIPIDKSILRKFLKAGFMENGILTSTTERGTPQGAVISPALTVMTLSGLENYIRPQRKSCRAGNKINVVAYADDFIVTAATREILEDTIKPKLVNFLKERGLELSKKKTRITHITEGFDFLGFNMKKYKNGKVMTKPSQSNIQRFKNELKFLIRKGKSLPTDKLIHALNEKIIGWTNYYKCVVSSKIFSKIDHFIFQTLWKWALKRHARHGKRWIKDHYYTSIGGNNWRFFANMKEGKRILLKRASDTKIRRHIKIKAKAHLYDPNFEEYFRKRENMKRAGCLTYTKPNPLDLDIQDLMRA